MLPFPRPARPSPSILLMGALLVPLLAVPADAVDCTCGNFPNGLAVDNDGVNVALTVTATNNQAITASSNQYGITGYTTGTSMVGVRGWATAGNGVYGVTDSTSAGYAGVTGVATSTTGQQYGVSGTTSSTSGIALKGTATAVSGFTTGALGSVASPDGVGVTGSNTATTGTGAGVRGFTSSTSGYGVYAESLATSGTSYGVYAKNSAPNGYGVYSRMSATTGTGPAVYGTTASTSGKGISGNASGTSGTTYGVYGAAASTSGTAVYGTATATTGTTYGAYGRSSSTSGRGVYGYASATSGTTYGVYGRAPSATGYGVYSEGNFAVTGTKSAVVDSSAGPTEMYSEEGTEVWFTDYGNARLEEGATWVELDEEFLELVTVDEDNPLRVFIQLEGDAHGVYVVPGDTGFDVVELKNGRSNAPFSYRVVAHRAGYENRRMRQVDVALPGASAP